MADIAIQLNLRKIPTKSGCVWESHTIRTILKNCNYVGKVRYAARDKKRAFEAEGLHEPIIEEKLFKQVQQLLSKSRKLNSTKKPLTANYYMGFLYCPDCGNKLLTHNDYRKRKDGTLRRVCSYRCEHGMYIGCTFKSVVHSKIDIAFEEYMKNISAFEPITEIDMVKKQEKIKTEQLLQVYMEKLGKLKSRESETLNLYIDGAVEFEEYRNMKSKIDNAIAEITVDLLERLDGDNQDGGDIIVIR